MVGTNDLDKATGFYDTLLDIIDLKRIEKLILMAPTPLNQIPKQ